MAIKGLIFDNFGVLMSQVYGSLQQVLPAKAKAALFDILNAADAGQIDANEQRRRLEELLASYNLDGASEIAAAIQRSDRNQSLFDFIAANRGKYKMGLLSNVSAVIWNYYTPEELARYFDEVVLSYQVKLAKPDPRIYQLTLDKLGLVADECVFADDNPRNVQAAVDLGIYGIVFSNTDDYLTHLREIEASA